MYRTIIMTLAETTLVFIGLFAGVWLVKMLLRKQLSAQLHYLIWGVVILRLLVPLSVDAPWSPAAFVPDTDPITISLGDTADDADTVQGAPADTAEVSPDTLSADKTLRGITVDWARLAVAVWFAGTALTGMIFWRRMRRLKNAVQRCRTQTPDWMTSLLDTCRQRAGVRRPVRLIVQSAVSVPAVMGIVHPVLIMPVSHTDKDNADETQHAFMHELMHVRRGDVAAIWCLNLLRAVYWFNPLVWLCFRQVTRDMEAACDSMTTASMPAHQMKGYIQTILRFSGSHDRLQTGAASLNDGCITMTQRITRMYMKRQSATPVRVLAAGLALVLTLAAFTTGCTPQTVQADPLADGYTRAETWKTDDITTGGNTIRIDAGVYMPDHGSYTVYDYVRGRFTQQDADRLIATFFGDRTLHTGWASPVTSDTPAAPEVSDGQIRDDWLDVMAETASGPVGLLISNAMDKSGVNPCIQLYGGTQYEPGDMAVTQAGGIKTTPAQAVQIAQELLDTCGFDGIQARYAYAGSVIDDATGEPRDDLPGGYMVECARYVDGIPVTAIDRDPDTQVYWSDEQIWICVDDTGVTGFMWTSRCDTGQALQSDVSPLALASLEDTVRQGLAEKYADTGKTTNTTVTVTINTVRLELARVPSGDDEWALIPAWCFYGTIDRYKDGKLTATTDRSRVMIFAVSAVDGTIIE